jgi:hypothetical protein
MRLRSVLLGAALGTLLAARAALAMDDVSGKVVDLTCQLASKGDACDGEGIKRGLPMALLTDDGQLYLLLENHDNPKPYAQLKDKGGQKVSLEGDKVTQGGTNGLIVETLK